jgi:hypothetical protein
MFGIERSVAYGLGTSVSGLSEQIAVVKSEDGDLCGMGSILQDDGISCAAAFHDPVYSVFTHKRGSPFS